MSRDLIGDLLRWDTEDQGIEADISTPRGASKRGNDDDVFLTREDAVDGRCGGFRQLSSDAHQLAAPKPVPRRQKVDPTHSVSPPKQPPTCTAQWSLSHRCLECAWKRRRGGRPHHPPPPILSIAPLSPSLVNSLGTTRDSGYEPSPTSVFSFTFASDEDDFELDDTVPEDEFFDSLSSAATADVTDVADAKIAVVGEDVAKLELFKPVETAEEETESIEKKRVEANAQFSSPNSSKKAYKESLLLRKRSKSLPELWASEPVFSYPPIVVRPGNFRKETELLTPTHGRNSSLPATTPDGRPIFAAPPTAHHHPGTAGSRASKERLIDLTEEDPDGNAGHHRRVLVLALPDLLVDHDYLKQNGGSSSISSASSPRSVSGKISSTGPKSKGTLSLAAQHSPMVPTTRPSLNRSLLFKPTKAVDMIQTFSDSSSDSLSLPSPSEDPGGDQKGEGEGQEGGRVVCRSRPAWRRPRALSCDVTLEVELGQELRRIADNFTSQSTNGWLQENGVWRSIRDTIGRRFSISSCPPLQEGDSEEELMEQNVAHSLPTSSSSWFT